MTQCYIIRHKFRIDLKKEEKRERKKMKKTLKNNTSIKWILLMIIAFPLVLASCSVDEVNPANANNERIDLKINGDLTLNFNEEATDLATYSLNANTILHPEERKVIINLGYSHTLELTFFNQSFVDPLEAPFQYGAFSLDLLDDRMAYVVAEYYNNGKKAYSTISGFIRGVAQYNVVRANDKGDFYLFSIDDIKLYEVSDEDLRPNTKSIVINGTFTLQK